MSTASTGVRLRSVPSVATLIAARTRDDRGVVTVLNSWTEGPSFADVQQLLAAGVAPDAVLLTPGDARQALAWLESLRRDPRLGLAPILLSRSFGESIDALSDGVAATPEAVAQLTAPMAARYAALSRRESGDGDERLLSYLYVRDGKTLTPVADWHDQRIYRYPLADALCRGDEDGFLMLERLRRRGLLEPVALVQRIHLCPACTAGHLLFIETCPQCGGIDTAPQNFLHCYACGNVGTQEEYLTADGLGCPKCAVRLRHIGVDYDRALETLACKACGGRFTEPRVKARCLHCQHLSGTDELAERSYHQLRLSTAGELAARTGQLGDLFKLIDEFSQAHPEYFTRTLEWLLGLARRHAELQFGLVCLRFANVRLLTARLPRHRVAQMFDVLAQRLRALIRTTDLFMREHDEICWLLLPQTTPAGMSILVERLAALATAAPADDGLGIEIATATFNSGDRSEDVASADLLMAALRNRVS